MSSVMRFVPKAFWTATLAMAALMFWVTQADACGHCGHPSYHYTHRLYVTYCGGCRCSCHYYSGYRYRTYRGYSSGGYSTIRALGPPPASFPTGQIYQADDGSRYSIYYDPPTGRYLYYGAPR
jgi:hypothetical protein